MWASKRWCMLFGLGMIIFDQLKIITSSHNKRLSHSSDCTLLIMLKLLAHQKYTCRLEQKTPCTVWTIWHCINLLLPTVSLLDVFHLFQTHKLLQKSLTDVQHNLNVNMIYPKPWHITTNNYNLSNICREWCFLGEKMVGQQLLYFNTYLFSLPFCYTAQSPICMCCRCRPVCSAKQAHFHRVLLLLLSLVILSERCWKT